MKDERILWKALCNPEQITTDERMEQLEFKGYYWGYQTLLFLVYLITLLIGQCGSWIESAAMRTFFALILLFGALMLVESGRFLYSCYQGIQEFSDPRLRKGNRGKVTFFGVGISVGVWGVLNLGFLFGWKHPLPWISFVGGCLFYWLLCHLAYLHYALEMEREEPLKGAADKLSLICGLGLIFYMAVFLVLGMRGAGYLTKNGAFLGTERITLSEETRWFWDDIEKGRQHFYELQNKKIESAYFTDLQEGPDSYDFPNGRIAARTLSWHTADGISCVRYLGSEESGKLLWETYWDREGIYVAGNGMWIPEGEYWAEEQVTEEALWNDTPGIFQAELSQIESIVREFRGQEIFYTVRYKPDGGIAFSGTESADGRIPEEVTESYTLNEFGVLAAYSCEIRGKKGSGVTPYVERSSWKLVSVNREEIEKEAQAILGQYPQKETTLF